MTRVSLKFIIDFFTDKSIITTQTKSNIIELFQISDEKCEKKFRDFLDLILFVIDSDYDINSISNKKIYIQTIIDDIIDYIQDTQLLINKPKVISQIKNNDLTQDIILLVSYIFDINIIIHENNILKVYYFSEKYNKYRNTVLLKIEQDPSDGTEYYKLLINDDKFIFNNLDKNLNELLEKEYIIPIGFIPNKSFEVNNDKLKIINDRLISEIFVNKQALEIKDTNEEKDVNKNVNQKHMSKDVNKNDVEEINNLSDSDCDNNINEKLLLDYTKMQYNVELESDDD